jgi:hypothetical protein
MVSIVKASPTSLVSRQIPAMQKNGSSRLGEEPFVLSLFSFFDWIGELVEAIRNDQATIAGELTAIGAEIIDRSLVLAGPTPAALHEVSFARHAFDRADDWSDIGDLDVLASSYVWRAFAETNFDLEVRKAFKGRGDVLIRR